MTITNLTRDLGNIGPVGRRQRLVFGAAALAAAGALIAAIDRSGASRWWRIGAFPLIWFGLVGVLQAQARTCIAFAARGSCDRDAGINQLTPELVTHFRQRARWIVRLATIAASLLTALSLAL